MVALQFLYHICLSSELYLFWQSTPLNFLSSLFFQKQAHPVMCHNPLTSRFLFVHWSYCKTLIVDITGISFDWWQLCLQFTGILTEEITAQGLSNLNWTADGAAQVYCHLALSVSTFTLFHFKTTFLFYLLLVFLRFVIFWIFLSNRYKNLDCCNVFM